MNAHKEKLNNFFQQTKEISERKAKFYMEKFLQKTIVFKNKESPDDNQRSVETWE